MCPVRAIVAPEATGLITDDVAVTAPSFSGMRCPNAVLAATGERFQHARHPQNVTSIHSIAAGDTYDVEGIDHLTQPDSLAKVIADFYPSGPPSTAPPLTWQMINDNTIPAWNLPSGILFDMHRGTAARRPGVLIQTGMNTYVDPLLQGGAMNEKTAQQSLVRRARSANDDWLFFLSTVPQVATIRATTADERSNPIYEHRGAYLGPLEQITAARNNGDIIIAQAKRQVVVGSPKPKEVCIPGVLVDYIVTALE